MWFFFVCMCVLLKDMIYGAVWNRCCEWDISSSIACDCGNLVSVATGIIPNLLQEICLSKIYML